MIRLSGATFRPISRSHRRYLPPLMCLRMQWLLRAAVVLNGKTDSAKAGLDTSGMDELIAKARRFVRERFRSYQTELKSRGIKRARARRDANRERQDIVTGETAADA